MNLLYYVNICNFLIEIPRLLCVYRIWPLISIEQFVPIKSDGKFKIDVLYIDTRMFSMFAIVLFLDSDIVFLDVSGF